MDQQDHLQEQFGQPRSEEISASGLDQQPAYQQPVYQQPVYQQPVYQYSQNPYQQYYSAQGAPNAPQQYYAAQQPADNKKEKKGKGVVLTIISTILILALIAGSCYGTAMVLNRKWAEDFALLNQVMDNKIAAIKSDIEDAKTPGQSVSGTPGPATEGMLTPAQVYEKNVGAVVAISNQGVSTNIYGQISQTASSGSGFIISEDGYVVSNYHVVADAQKLMVITSDSKEHEAKLIGYDSINDIAVLKIEGEDLPHIEFGSSDKLIVGDQVAAIGNPLGELTSTLTVGYVSAKDRMVVTGGPAINMLQTDAAINSGNSGGPLFNMLGQVVGVTTAKYSGTSNSGATIEGIGFAIPIDDVIGIIEDLQTKGYVSGAYLSVMVRDMDAAVAEEYGLPLGAYVDSVEAGGCAAEAGVQAKDIIVNVGGYDVESVSDLSRALRRFEGNEETTITVFRNGAQVHLKIKLAVRPKTDS